MQKEKSPDVKHSHFLKHLSFEGNPLGSKGGAVVRALTSHQYGPGSNPGVDAICGLSLLLVLSLALRGFSPGTPVFPSTNTFKFQFDLERTDTFQ